MLPESLKAGSKVLTGKVKNKEREEIVKRAKNKELKILFATDKLIGEGFDESLISVIYLTCPIADDTRLIQYVGRARRTAPGKKFALIIDFFDAKEPILRRSAKKRVIAYIKNGRPNIDDPHIFLRE
jgi:superfamily II DNA or RNA helicase